MKDKPFYCTYCHHSFHYEDRFLKHQCRQKQRAEEINSPIGQAAWFYYQSWMRAQHHMLPHIKAFLHSKFYKPFIRFAEFVKQVRIPDPELYILQMVALDMAPMLWTNDQVYTAFLEYMDRKLSATRHAEITIDTLFDYADSLGCQNSPGDVFVKTNPNEIIQLIRQRKLSPWLLLHSGKFKKFYAGLSKDQQIVIETMIRPTYWAEKLKKDPESVEVMKTFVKQMDL